MRFAQFMSAILLVVGGLVCTAHQATAAELTWHFQSDYPYSVDVELYSQSRNHVWPGNNRVWTLDDYDTHGISISCQYNEKICYGAWSRGDPDTYWGAGPDGQYACEDCCARCGRGDTSLKHLIP